MIRYVVLVCLAALLGVVGCGDAGEDGTGGEAGGGSGGGPATGGGGGEGGMGGEGGTGGEPGPVFTSLMDRVDAGLVYQLEKCQCQDPEPISESACLATASELPFSDRQNECFDAVVLGEEAMSLENRFACLIDVDRIAADCLAEVNECSDGEITACVEARTMGLQGCPTPTEDVRAMLPECQQTVVGDGVDAFLDAQSAQCDCVTGCTSAEPEPEVVDCMEETLQAEIDMLEPVDRSTELRCFTRFWRERAVCFGNEETCDGPVTACLDIPPMVCAIGGSVLDDCL